MGSRTDAALGECVSPTTESNHAAAQRVEARAGSLRDVLQYEDAQLGMRALHDAA